MPRHLISLGALLCVIVMLFSACQKSEIDSLPEDVSSFMTEYFAFQPIQSTAKTKDGGWVVSVKSGATLWFAADGNWTAIDGNGTTLPAVLIHDQVPATLWAFIVELEATENVYSLEKTGETMIVGLLDTHITYNRTTGSITYPSVVE